MTSVHLIFLSIAIVLSAQTGLDVINTVYICPTRYCRAMEIFEAKYDYNKYGDGLLCLKRGDRLVVTDKSASGWWAARNLESDEFGYIPSAYVECVAVLDPPREELPELSEGILSDETMATVTETGKIKMDALCELTAKLQTNPGAYHPKFSEDVNDNDVSENELHTSVKPRNVSREQNLLHKDLKFNQQRGIQLGRPELVKTWEKFESKKSQKEQNLKETERSSELSNKLKVISDKLEAEEKGSEVEANKPEFMKVSLRKATKPEEAR